MGDWKISYMPCTGCGAQVSPVLCSNGPYLMEGPSPRLSKQKHTRERCLANQEVAKMEKGSFEDRFVALVGEHEQRIAEARLKVTEDDNVEVTVTCWDGKAEDWKTGHGVTLGEAIGNLERFGLGLKETP